jgi:hypothetical protein
MLDEGVTQLEFVCLTHPDLDHLLGMADLVTHFTTEKRSIKYFCHPPADPKTIQRVLKWARRTPARSEYRKLVEVLIPLFARRAVIRRPMSSNAEPMDDWTGLTFVPLAPDPNTDFDLMVSGLQRLAVSKETVDVNVGDVNAISVAIAVGVKTESEPISVLLGGDLFWKEWKWALACWERKAISAGCTTGYRIIKVPHHGSALSHHPDLASKFAGTHPRFAVISVGHRFSTHPDRRVLEDYDANHWKILLTQKRVGGVVSQKHPFQLLSGNRSVVQFSEGQDIVIKVLTDGCVTAQPDAALLDPLGIQLYEEGQESWQSGDDAYASGMAT